MPDLTTLANVKLYAGIVGTADDALLTKLITAVSLAVERYLGREILQATFTAVMDGNGAALLPLPQYPITAVTYLRIDNLAKIQSVSYFDGGFLIRGRHLFFRNGTLFPVGLGNIEVQYTAGYAAVPADIAQAVDEIVATNYKTKDQLGWSSKSLAGETISINISLKAYSERCRQALDTYKNVLPL